MVFSFFVAWSPDCVGDCVRCRSVHESNVLRASIRRTGRCAHRCHFNPESLEGDNQYHCERCGKKVDAERRLKIVKAPPVLQVQLLRYVYDRVTWEKKKLRDRKNRFAAKLDES